MNILYGTFHIRMNYFYIIKKTWQREFTRLIRLEDAMPPPYWGPPCADGCREPLRSLKSAGYAGRGRAAPNSGGLQGDGGGFVWCVCVCVVWGVSVCGCGVWGVSVRVCV